MVIFDALSKKYCGHSHVNSEKEVSEKTSDNQNDLSAIETKSGEVDIKRASFKLALGLILHHFPEGIATMIALYYEFELGVLVALALSLHDIPAGISIACTVYCTTQSYMKVFWVCLVAFLAYPLGAVVGIAIIESNGDSELLNAILFGIICGILLFISFCEVTPTMIDITNNNPKIRNYTLISIFIGLLFMEVGGIILAFIDFHAH